MKFFFLIIALFSIISLTNAQKIIPDYNTTDSLSQLKKYFPQKYIYIDLWASWCVPCVQEFKYRDHVDSLLTSKNIGLLYISLDSSDMDWRAAVDNYGLNGRHVRANKSLQDQITMLLWHIKDAYSIPRYFIIDSNFKIVDSDIPPPSSGEKLNARINGL